MSQFRNHVHVFRAIAIIGVVAAHSLQNFSWPSVGILYPALDTLFNQSTIWFAFIAGYLFQHLLPRFETVRYYRTKLRNVIVPYLIWSVPALVASLFFIVQDVPAYFYEGSLLKQILLFLVTGKHLAPFWYVPAISLIFLIAPLLKWGDEYRILYVSVPLLLLLSAYLGRDGLVVALNLPLVCVALSKAVYLLAPYVMGMMACRYREAIFQLMKRIHWLVLLLVLIFFYLEINHYQQQHLYIYLFKMTSCFSLMYYLEKFGRVFGSRLNIVADLSFGLFFIHGFILAATKIILGELSDSPLLTGNLLTYMIFVTGVLLVCLLMLSLARAVLGRKSRWVVGC
ncbi:MAG: acyltransferase family protein [Parahaliea sp.]